MKLLLLDCESTGPDALNDRLVTIFVGVMDHNGEWEKQTHVMFNPGIPIPDEAAGIHGITTEKAVAEGVPVEEAPEKLSAIRKAIIDSVRDENLPVGAYNGSYDFTLINRELTHYGLTPILWEDLFLIDPIIIDRHIDKYRKGKRTLTTVAGHYGVEVDESKAHDASYDCYLTGRIIQSQRFSSAPELNRSRSELMRLQKAWRYEQSVSLESYLRRSKNDPSIVVNPSWPVLK